MSHFPTTKPPMELTALCIKQEADEKKVYSVLYSLLHGVSSHEYFGKNVGETPSASAMWTLANAAVRGMLTVTFVNVVVVNGVVVIDGTAASGIFCTRSLICLFARSLHND